MTTQIPSRMEGLRPSIKQTMMEEGLSVLAMTLRGSMGIYPSNYFPEMEETPPVEMSDRTHQAWRAKKQMEHAPVEGEGSIIYLLVEQLQGLGLSAGFTLDEWRMGVRYLRALAVHQGEGSVLEWLERAEPPRSYDEVDWQAFIHAIMPEIRFLEGRGYLSPSPRGVMSPAVELPIRQSTTATPDMLQMAEESLMMPCQPDETGSAAGRHIGAVQQVRNLPHVKEETLSTSSRTMVTLDDKATQIEQVALQRVCNSQI
jgi:hypothetical protein